MVSCTPSPERRGKVLLESREGPCRAAFFLWLVCVAGSKRKIQKRQSVTAASQSKRRRLGATCGRTQSRKGIETDASASGRPPESLRLCVMPFLFSRRANSEALQC